MKTECPHCHTIFRVSEQQLDHGAGQVRCGHCFAIFTAEIPQQMSFDDLLDDQDVTTEIESETEKQDVVPEQIYSESFSRRNPRPITRKLENALRRRKDDLPVEQESPVDINPVDTENEHSTDVQIMPEAVPETRVTTDETAVVTDVTLEEFGHVLPDVIPPSLRAETRAGKKRLGFVSSLFWLLAICLMLGVGLAQYAWYDRMHWLQYPQARPWFELACHYLQCRLPEPRDPSQIELTRKNVYTHPNDKQGLMVSGTMINQAEFAQPYPVLELRFENIRGEAIAARRFTPDEYLDLPIDQITKIQPGEPVAFTLEIVDPGPDVVSYEFTFL